MQKWSEPFNEYRVAKDGMTQIMSTYQHASVTVVLEDMDAILD